VAQTPTLPFIIAHDIALTATFIPIPYTVGMGVLGSGSVTLDPAKLAYTYDDMVTATAAPATGWTFTGWSGDLNGANNPQPLTINASKAITANFSLKQYTITVTASDPSAGTVTGSGLYHHGDMATVTATPATGFAFDAWTDAASPLSTSNTFSFIADRDRVLVASFKPLQTATLRLKKVVAGSTAYAPPQGWHFNLAGTGYTLPAAGGTQIISALAPGTYTLSEQVNANYTASVTCGDQTASAGTIQVSLLPGQTLECVFTNTLRDAILTVNKVVINDNGGIAQVTDFPLFVNGAPVSHGVAISVAPGTHSVSEVHHANYASTFSGDCTPSGLVTLLPGQNATCTITNNDLSPAEANMPLKLEKSVGLVDGSCATSTTISVLPGEVVYYCYAITNQSNVTFAAHTLVDNRLGTIIDGLDSPLAPGQTLSTIGLGITASHEIESAAVTSATWTSRAPTSDITAQASATTTVTLGTQDFHMTVDATYTPPANSPSANGSATGGQIAYQLNLRNTGTAILKELQLHVLLPKGTSLRSNIAEWKCVSAPSTDILCTRSISILEPGEVVSHALDLGIFMGTNIDQITLTVTAKTQGTPLTPPLSRSMTVSGPNAQARVSVYLPGLRHHPTVATTP
jgi:uncharacterized repeat protein (TIGR02543 family)